MNKDKIIKDLKERNDKLSNQYRLRDIRCVHLERENERLQQENIKLKELEYRFFVCSDDEESFTLEDFLRVHDKLYKCDEEKQELQNRINKAIDLNKQIIKDTKSFYRPTADTIYSGDCLIDIAEQNIEILGGKE